MASKKKVTKKSKSKPKERQTPVTRAFLLKLADTIHNPKTKTFLRLCNGTLQNGPDPEDAKRPMHCGLGELYFAMTGLQPEQTHVNESDVVEMAFNRSPLFGRHAAHVSKLTKGIKQMKLPEYISAELERAIDNMDATDDEVVAEFKDILNNIPDTNDDGHDDTTEEYDAKSGETRTVVCSPATYKARSARVAKQLREAAKLLP